MNALKTNKLTELPAQDIELERKILHSALLDSVKKDCLYKLNEDDFYNEQNRRLYKYFLEILNERGSLDIDLLPRKIKDTREFKELLDSEILYAFELDEYVNRLKKTTNQRKIQRLAYEATVKAKEDRNPTEIALWLAGELEKLEKITEKESIEKQNLRISNLLYEELQKEDMFGIASGYPELDYQIRGFVGGSFTILGGTPGSGKTTWLLNAVNHFCKKGKKVLHVNLEMSNVMLQMKMLSIVTGLSTSLLVKTKKEIDEEIWKIIVEGLNQISNYSWYRIGETDTMVSDIDVALKEHKFDICVIDYLQLLKSAGKKTRYEEISDISRGLKKLATKYNIPVICLASINRNYAHRDNKEPVMSDIRDAGTIEYDGDLILFLHRATLHEEYDESMAVDEYEYNHHADLIIAKNRWGYANQKIEFYFDGEKSLFREMKIK